MRNLSLCKFCFQRKHYLHFVVFYLVVALNLLFSSLFFYFCFECIPSFTCSFFVTFRSFPLFTCAFVTIIGDCRYELLFYPRYHLDQSSLLCRKPLLANPMVMDVYQEYLLVTYRPFDVHVYHVKITGELSPSSSPDLQVIKCLKKNLLGYC